MSESIPQISTDTSPAELLRRRIAPLLVAAMRAKDKPRVAVLREVLAGLGNAEALAPAAAATARGEGSEHVAAAVGLGAGEADRAVLSEQQVAGLVEREASEREAAATTYEGHGDHERAAGLRSEAAMIRELLA